MPYEGRLVLAELAYHCHVQGEPLTRRKVVPMSRPRRSEEGRQHSPGQCLHSLPSEYVASAAGVKVAESGTPPQRVGRCPVQASVDGREDLPRLGMPEGKVPEAMEVPGEHFRFTIPKR